MSAGPFSDHGIKRRLFAFFIALVLLLTACGALLRSKTGQAEKKSRMEVHKIVAQLGRIYPTRGPGLPPSLIEWLKKP